MHYDVIVIGLGINGRTTCYELAKRGLKVLGLEQFSFDHDKGSSHGDSRIIRRAYFEHPDYIPLLNHAYHGWDQIQSAAHEELFVRNGVVVYADKSSSSVYQGILEAKSHGVQVEEFSHREALQKWPHLRAPTSYSAIYEKDAGYIRAEEARKALLELALNAGAALRENSRINGFQANSSGVTIKTNEETHTAQKIVITVGPWSRQLLTEVKVNLKIKKKILAWFQVRETSGGNPCFAFHDHRGFTYGFPSLDGKTIKVGEHMYGEYINHPEEKDLGEPSFECLDGLKKFVAQHLPESTSTIDHTDTCLYTMTPDEHFIIDLHPIHKNVVIGTGFSGHGFKFAPVTAKALADLAVHGKTDLPIHFLAIDRQTITSDSA